MKFVTPEAALTALKQEETTAEKVLDEFGYIDGIEHSIAVAKAHQTNTKQENGVTKTVSRSRSSKRL